MRALVTAAMLALVAAFAAVPATPAAADTLITSTCDVGGAFYGTPTSDPAVHQVTFAGGITCPTLTDFGSAGIQIYAGQGYLAVPPGKVKNAVAWGNSFSCIGCGVPTGQTWGTVPLPAGQAYQVVITATLVYAGEGVWGISPFGTCQGVGTQTVTCVWKSTPQTD
jgi:hypothetical protein